MTNLSKTVAYALRHKPEQFGLTVDRAGWVAVSELLEGLRAEGVSATEVELQEIVAEDTKQRFSIVGGRIRANQGHSIPVELGLQALTPPEFLFHGTATRFLASIEAEGIKSMSRHAVHLSESMETAEKVGQRHGKPVILTVASQQMHEQGFEFTRSENGVWLVSSVPVAFICVPS